MLKQKLYLLFCVFSVSLFAQTGFKTAKDTALLKEKINAISKETNSLESDFTQVKMLSMLSEKITSKGHFCFKKDNLLRWEYVSPYTYVIVINKDKVFIKDDTKLKKYDMNSNKIFKEINDIMISCIDGNILASNKFKISYGENDKAYRLELTPLVKGMKESLKVIYMYFDKAVTSVTKLEMVETTDDFTIIDFTNKKVNGNIPAEKFILK
ncbi:MAG TPA: outer membrane lipoprotein carrier protein LolA [Bacteroidia bacterium]|jgi:outer membrane lipoprotein-sorting protein|nr:outer membrane lipoprotein carrier protein LolA [Bacteroidia bacterium]